MGRVMALKRELSPKMSPTKPPTTGPSIKAAIKTGMCMVVAFKGPIGTKPKGVMPKTTVMAPRIPIMTMSRVVRKGFFNLLFIKTSDPAREDAGLFHGKIIRCINC